MMSIGVMSAARTNNLLYASVGNAFLNRRKKIVCAPFLSLADGLRNFFYSSLDLTGF